MNKIRGFKDLEKRKMEIEEEIKHAKAAINSSFGRVFTMGSVQTLTSRENLNLFLKFTPTLIYFFPDILTMIPVSRRWKTILRLVPVLLQEVLPVIRSEQK